MKNIKESSSKKQEENKILYNININNTIDTEIIKSNNEESMNKNIEGNLLKNNNYINSVSPSAIQNSEMNNINYQNHTFININNNIVNNQIQQIGFKLTKKLIMNSFINQSTTMIYQKLLLEAKYETIKSIVRDLKGEYRIIINDKNGNYFANDLFKICDQKERIEILEELSPILSQDCNNNYSTHPIQTLIEFSSCELEYKLILFSFNDYNKLLFAALNPNGAYVIQKIIERIPERYRAEFNLLFISFISFVSKQKYGIVSVKKFISCTRSEDIINKILNYIKDNFIGLAMDQYGNYLIQFLLEKWNNYQEGKEIKNLVIQNFKTMIQYKYSSFVCESFVKTMNKNEKMDLNNLLNLNEIEKTDNPYSIKIMKLLGIDIDINNNNCQNQIQFPSIFINMNNNNLFLNYMNHNVFNNKNLLNINIENKYYNSRDIKNYKKKYKNNNNKKIY